MTTCPRHRGPGRYGAPAGCAGGGPASPRKWEPRGHITSKLSSFNRRRFIVGSASLATVTALLPRIGVAQSTIPAGAVMAEFLFAKDGEKIKVRIGADSQDVRFICVDGAESAPGNNETAVLCRGVNRSVDESPDGSGRLRLKAMLKTRTARIGCGVTCGQMSSAVCPR